LKKLSRKREKYNKNKQYKIISQQKRFSRRKKHFCLKRKIFRLVNRELIKEHEARQAVFRNVYKKKRYTSVDRAISIKGQLGLEGNDIDNFLDIASSIIDFDNKRLIIDLNSCSRMWPSAITLFCSLFQWVNLKTSVKYRPLISSTSSRYDKVNSYLSHSGFYDYVQRQKDDVSNYYNEDNTVKIKKETRNSLIEEREKEIVDLLNSIC
jgi:hypothetical protein